MRSRYVAYILKDGAYLLNTWARVCRPAKLDFDGDTTRWEGLSVLGCERGEPEDQEGTVEFIARYRVNGEPGQLHERSSFVREPGGWVYLRGEMLPEVDFSKVGRNDLCPCGSGRKYKKCCGT